MNHIENRKIIIKKLREELIGPAPNGAELNCQKPIVFAEAQESYKPYRQAGSGDEILQRDAPLNRYGAGILYPLKTETEETPSLFDVIYEDEAEKPKDVLSDTAAKLFDAMAERAAAADDTDFDLTSANKLLPSSMGVSFLAEIDEKSVLTVTATGGRYRKLFVEVAGAKRRWWRREAVKLTAAFDGAKLLAEKAGKVQPAKREAENTEDLNLQIEVFSRPHEKPNQRLLTVCFVNRSKGGRDENSVFQAHFEGQIENENSAQNILPYPEANPLASDEEEKSIALLYRKVQTFAVGHGCAADWQTISNEARAESVSAECFPVCEVPSITPDIERADGSQLTISMAKLAGLISEDDGLNDLADLIGEYESWIRRRQNEISSLPAEHQSAAAHHLAECKSCAARMREGLQYLQADMNAFRAFQLANRAVLIQQYRSKSGLRAVAFDTQTQHWKFSVEAIAPDLLGEHATLGKWRAFQIAFLLMSLRSSVCGDAPNRETVELIWFPTGGGKTEAYLGLTAFALFMRRLENPTDAGTHVLMRYTLRLLTAQQFQRACALLCAMEFLRRENLPELGAEEFSIALWLGGAVTPNTRTEAKDILTKLRSGSRYVENKFIVNRCPWCAAQIGLVENAPRNVPKTVGYEEKEGTIVFKCSDRDCEFYDSLPVFVIDEDIYEKCPSLVIGTVDKFAMLAWKPEARALFGFDNNGERIASPPGLIIQDELHLISGPLGSMVGLYESLIEELCTDRRNSKKMRPKIISSTATTRCYAEQIRALYAREKVQLFPPPGLDVGDSFFARYAKDANGNLRAGRIFVGVNAPALGVANTEVRTYTALLQAPHDFTLEERDPWWTLLIFFGNLRSLGNTISLFQSNIPAYFMTYRNRLRRERIRFLDQPLELTGRLQSDEVPAALAKLETKCTDKGKKPVDVCLASNIIEVGVDVDRLSLITVLGQPKTTAQYIQVTGRVGRRWWERPGLVVTIYSPTRPRDRSHFEHFRSYHEKLYAQVEPTSVTPFSAPALERALHATMVAYVRQTGTRAQAETPFPFPFEILQTWREILRRRVEAVDAEEAKNFAVMFDRRINEWKNWQRPKWNADFRTNDTTDALLRSAGAFVDAKDKNFSWATPTSMRSVDAEAEIAVTQLYNLIGENE